MLTSPGWQVLSADICTRSLMSAWTGTFARAETRAGGTQTRKSKSSVGSERRLRWCGKCRKCVFFVLAASLMATSGMNAAFVVAR